ncbi:hypothetical protein J2S70_000281 [Trueperella bonasi]|uniref:Uncharacterized protein n=1 Tax=Trueperella bonasi TaxID=312286 RepID=A0ABT9NE83_9ACTO|nr:hypothetical protein [Trueperella bonasi]MDP9805699.1 hypothetical protein [Trueperella bonasi]
MGSLRSANRRVADWHPLKLKVHPGIQGRIVIRQMAHELSAISDLSQLEAIPPVEFLPEADPLNSGSLADLTFVGDVNANDDYDDLFSHIPKHDASLAEITDFIQNYWRVAFDWIEAALAANLITHAMVRRALSNATVGYAFGEHQRSIAVDSLATAQQRDQADGYFSTILQLPGLEDWHALPTRAHVEYRDDTNARLQPGSPPSIGNVQWWASSQIPVPVWIAYDLEDPQVFAEDDDQLTDKALDLMGMTREAYLADRARQQAQEVPIESTAQVYGDDAGDFPIDHPLHELHELNLYELTDTNSLRALLERYPARLSPVEDSCLYDDWAGIDAPINLVVNWTEFARDYDGVRFGVPAALQLAYVPVVVDNSGTVMLTGWTPGSTIYFIDPTRS